MSLLRTVVGAAHAGSLTVSIANGRTKTAAEWTEEIFGLLVNAGARINQPVDGQRWVLEYDIRHIIHDNLVLAIQQERDHAAHIATRMGAPEIATAIGKRT